ncbi:hypothetical protein [Actinomyces wuliandei]|uniref:hypothetical protein n=1 Tax=Actinomyces wuliandei TaxID=2057743 RepID=UPI000FD89E4B|nr:hypothetical protein [Actinomyces wuliandei]
MPTRWEHVIGIGVVVVEWTGVGDRPGPLRVASHTRDVPPSSMNVLARQTMSVTAAVCATGGGLVGRPMGTAHLSSDPTCPGMPVTKHEWRKPGLRRH